MPTPFEGMLLGSGYPQEVSVWDHGVDGYRQTGTQLVNQDGVSVWRQGFRDVWRENGVWDDGKLLQSDYFAHTADFADGYLRPFIDRYSRAIREVDPEALIFVEGAPGGKYVRFTPEQARGIVNATHWYDVLTLYTKHYRSDLAQDWETNEPIHGREAVRSSYAAQLRSLRDAGIAEMGGAPTLIGEFGLPFDLDDGAAYRNGDFSAQVAALDAYAGAMDANLLSFSLWNYTTDNSNEHGDQWCGEDLSLYSRDQRANPEDINSGGRGLEGIVRPYALATAGTPLSMRFDLATRTFELVFRANLRIHAPTEIFVPRLQYPDGYDVTLSAGTYERAEERQLLIVHGPESESEVALKIAPKSPSN